MKRIAKKAAVYDSVLNAVITARLIDLNDFNRIFSTGSAGHHSLAACFNFASAGLTAAALGMSSAFNKPALASQAIVQAAVWAGAWMRWRKTCHEPSPGPRQSPAVQIQELQDHLKQFASAALLAEPKELIEKLDHYYGALRSFADLHKWNMAGKFAVAAATVGTAALSPFPAFMVLAGGAMALNAQTIVFNMVSRHGVRTADEIDKDIIDAYLVLQQQAKAMQPPPAPPSWLKRQANALWHFIDERASHKTPDCPRPGPV